VHRIGITGVFLSSSPLALYSGNRTKAFNDLKFFPHFLLTIHGFFRFLVEYMQNKMEKGWNTANYSV